ncbi:MAG: hypothetical protein IPL78_11155 [Chloroflexi bacterium]|nr:hypothetical protein [Chloroflexota bacterium]
MTSRPERQYRALGMFLLARRGWSRWHSEQATIEDDLVFIELPVGRST